MATKEAKPKIPGAPTPIADVPGVIVTWDYTHTELINTPLTILSYMEIETQYGPAFVTECLIKEKPHTALMGGQVLMQQLIKAEDAFPVSATIIKIGKYYTFQ